MTTHKKTVSALLVAASLMMAGVAFAQDATGGTAPSGDTPTSAGIPPRPDIRHPLGMTRDQAEAQRASTTNMLQQKRGELEARRASTTEMMSEKRANMEARVASTTEKMQERRKQESLRYAKRMEERMSAAFDRLSKLADRLDERIQKIDAANKNIKTDAAKTHLADARKKIEDGRAALAGLPAQVDVALTSADPKTGFAGVRDAVKVIEGDAKAAHQALIEAVKSLKAGVPARLRDDNEGGSTATSTATTTGSVTQ